MALETGLRIGELTDLYWSDIDFKKKVLYVRHNLCYFGRNGKYVFEMHETKTKNGCRTIPLRANAIDALKRQRIRKNKILLKGIPVEEEYADLVFVTKTTDLRSSSS